MILGRLSALARNAILGRQPQSSDEPGLLDITLTPSSRLLARGGVIRSPLNMVIEECPRSVVRVTPRSRLTAPALHTSPLTIEITR